MKINVRTFILLSLTLLFIASPCAQAQENPTSIDGWAKRLETFGKSVPQEEVFVHMDNSSYYLGDTIFYKAYCRLSTGQPSKLSGLLYVELFNNDGYLVEREKIHLVNGEGHGCFLLSDTLYGGYYELRAYTRWQLNWGMYEHPHSSKSKKWFYSKEMEREYFRDYEKLYSRVFPVYDKPKEPGDFFQDMTMRPMRRYFKADNSKPEAEVTFYPEGGNLVAGTQCRVAFEANDEDGKHLKGKLIVTDHSGQQVAEAETQERGRGSFVLSVKEGEKYKATFAWTADNGTEATQKCTLPTVETDGTALQVSSTGDIIHLDIQASGTAAIEELGYTVMSHGMMQEARSLGTGAKLQADIDASGFTNGVTQITLFNAAGRVYADRLVFVRHAEFNPQRITFSGINPNGYKAYEPIDIQIKADSKVDANGTSSVSGSTISVAVRDAAHSEYTFDSGNILTEMLLASQVKGFIEQPEYYFEADDEEHRQALDLLLMIQGWRRYNWVEMATPKAFTLREPYEKTEWIYGEVNRYETEEPEDLFSDAAKLAMDEAGMSADYDEFANSEYGDFADERFIRKWGNAKKAMLAAQTIKRHLGMNAEDFANLTNGDLGTYHPMDPLVFSYMTQENAMNSDVKRDLVTQIGTSGLTSGNLKNEVTVHAEFALDTKVVEGGEKAAVGEMLTYNNGLFRIEAPAFSNYCYFFCTASNQEKWKNGKAPIWIMANESKMNADGDFGILNYPEYYVRFRQPYPRFVKPYNFYQTTQNTSQRKTAEGRLVKVDDVHLMNEVTIGAKRSGLRNFDSSKPAFVIDAYEAFNEAVDAGFCPGYYLGSLRFISDVARTYIGDMNMERNYELEPRYNTHNLSFNFSPGQLNKYNHLHKLGKVYIYTDYAPRREGDKRYSQSDQPSVSVDLRIPENGAQFMAYRDRRKVLWGYSDCVDFYNPDYSHTATPNPKDYRRTLYWNPDLKLDSEGQATIHLFNNNSLTHITVSAEGLGQDGQPMTGISYPEDR